MNSINKVLACVAIPLLSFAAIVSPINVYGEFPDWQEGTDENWEQNYESDSPGSLPEPARRLPIQTVCVAILMLGTFAGCLVLESKFHKRQPDNA